ncbi:MAG: hypothetical protein A2758_01350 [Candidatus Zambryskibacteria bacterium RIFCSPHIGHO2_01_FULL_49_18]|uniref:Uncharacterized protein n=2 Tax=Candidatus Zambryskiibacteriota TaxID=1817925 RepID=A0A1G2T150_9BACT|nr:MAG: hypothetical protein A2758_01350 [Candidatus Zambryskibacteria bacterium RIFCSPHIGHO2_01_FULL_49_18]OHB05312.1 MAG: hypothetical protein A3A26_01845 [Candidatus Zambryskibacteria bacterium RIFCSPLOWO2_01_FULL_47_14]
MAKKQTLTPERVEAIFVDCLFRKSERTDKRVTARGITTAAGFHPGRLKKHSAEIAEMLAELPDGFRNSPTGASFLEACMDKHGNQWTGLHQRMEQLFLLGVATKKAKILKAQALRRFLNGSMPNCVVIGK